MYTELPKDTEERSFTVHIHSNCVFHIMMIYETVAALHHTDTTPEDAVEDT